MTAIVRPTDADRAALDKLVIDPLLLEDDGTDWSGRVVSKPWGSEFQIYRSGQFTAWQLNLNARAETSMHVHLRKSSVLTVSDGRVIVETLGGKRSLSAGDSVIIPAGVFHKTFALGAAVVMEIEDSSNRRDIVRLSDRYGRPKQGYSGIYKAEQVG